MKQISNLVAHVYSDLGLITKFAKTDADNYKTQYVNAFYHSKLVEEKVGKHK